MAASTDAPNMNDFNSSNFTTVDSSAVLNEANRRFSTTMIPCMVYAGVLMLVGIIGNSLVCYVFGVRLKRCTQNYFILFLALFDLMSCTIGLPAEIADMTLHFKYTSAALCKIMRFVNTFSAIASILTLIIIAIDRYRRIRKPLKGQIMFHHAKLSLIPILVLTVVFSAPSLYVYGLRTVDSGISDVTGLDCTISDEAKGTIVPLVYNSSLFVCFIILAVSLIVMYLLILRSLKKHAETVRRGSIGTLSSGSDSHHDNCPNILSSFSSEMDQNSSENLDKGNQFCDLSGCSSKNTSDNTDTANETVGDTEPKDSNIKHSNNFPGIYVKETTDNKSNFISSPTAGVFTSKINTHGKPTINNDFWEQIAIDSHPYRCDNKTSKDIDNIDDKKTSSVHTDNHHVSFDVDSKKPKGPKNKNKKPIINIIASFFNGQRRPSVVPILEEEYPSQSYHNSVFSEQENEKTRQENNKCQNLDKTKQNKEQKDNLYKRNYTRKTTIIAFVVTLVFILSFVPHLCLQVAHLILKGFDEKLEGAQLALYNTFLRSYFINNAANPIIYGVLNENFRTEVKLMVKRLWCCGRNTAM